MDEISNINEINTVLITGTKGKTTVSNIVNHVLSKYKNSLLVDTLGSHFNNVQVTNYDDSLKNFGKSPNVMPGRYIYWNMKNYKGNLKDFFAVLEAGLGCYAWGTGINEHDAGIFLNVYRDHIDGLKIKDENDIYERKSFVFNKIKNGGIYVVNLDNTYTLRSVEEKVIKARNLRLIGVTSQSSDALSLAKVRQVRGLDDIIYLKGARIYSLKFNEVYNLEGYKYYFNGMNVVMINNAMFAIAYLLNFLSKQEISTALNSFILAEKYGRFLGFKNLNSNQIVVVDYAHEPESLRYTTDFLRNYTGINPYVVTRVASDRNNDFLDEYGMKVSQYKNIGGITVFDKIDGVKTDIYVGREITRQKGESSNIFNKALDKYKVKFDHKIILNEQEALLDAISNADNKVVVIIYDDLESTINVLKQKNFERIF
jgi:UDP-N-acetylmuramyl tripeptide synthase